MKLRWSREARADMERIWHFNADRSVDLADRVKEAIQVGSERLVDFPHIDRPDKNGRRLLLLGRIQYVIAYGVEEDHVIIYAVRSTRENR